MLSDLIAEARADAKAFRENAVYTAEGSRVKLGANADRLDQYADRIEAQAAEIERLRGLVEELADDLEVEVQDRWGYDERLAHKLKRDMDVIVRARAALATIRETNDA